jgi:hypothetical protein
MYICMYVCMYVCSWVVITYAMNVKRLGPGLQIDVQECVQNYVFPERWVKLYRIS